MQYCTACQKAIATIVIMDLSGGALVGQQHLCSACAENMGVVQPKTQIKLSSEILEDLLGGLKGKSQTQEPPETACPGCGLSLSDFKVRGRLGCPRCYESFKPALVPLLRRVHDASSHRGRLPGRTTADLARADALAELRRRLEDAIQAERYEEAARIRDELRRAEKAGTEGHGDG